MGFDLGKLIGFACFGLDKAAQNVIKGVGTVLNAAGSLPKIFETICSFSIPIEKFFDSINQKYEDFVRVIDDFVKPNDGKGGYTNDIEGQFRLFLYHILTQDKYQKIFKKYLEKSIDELTKNIFRFGQNRLGDLVLNNGYFYTKEDIPFFKILLLTQIDNILCFLNEVLIEGKNEFFNINQSPEGISGAIFSIGKTMILNGIQKNIDTIRFIFLPINLLYWRLFFGYTYKPLMSEEDIKLFEKLTSNYGQDVFLSYFKTFFELIDEIFDKKAIKNLSFNQIVKLKDFGESFCIKLFGDSKIEGIIFKNIRKFIRGVTNIFFYQIMFSMCEIDQKSKYIDNMFIRNMFKAGFINNLDNNIKETLNAHYFNIYQYFFFAAAADSNSNSGISFRNESFLKEQKLYFEGFSDQLEKFDNLNDILNDCLKNMGETENKVEVIKSLYLTDYIKNQLLRREELILFKTLSSLLSVSKKHVPS